MSVLLLILSQSLSILGSRIFVQHEKKSSRQEYLRLKEIYSNEWKQRACKETLLEWLINLITMLRIILRSEVAPPITPRHEITSNSRQSLRSIQVQDLTP